MKTVEFWIWMTPDHRGKMSRTRYRMDETTALAKHPGAVKVPGTMELIEMPETKQESDAALYSTWGTGRRPDS